jgi:predicted transcriptional regulator
MLDLLQLKKLAMKKAKSEGITLTSFLNFAIKSYVDGNLKMTLINQRIQQAISDIDSGKFITHEELVKKLNVTNNEKNNPVFPGRRKLA